MARRLVTLTALMLLGPGASSAGAAITMSLPSSSTYVNSVPVSWSATTTPTQLRMIWTYQSGPYTVSAPVTLTLSSVATSGSFAFNPAAVTSDATHFSAVSSTLPDGTWHVVMQETQSGGVVVSTPVRTITTSTATAPAQLANPPATTTSNTFPVAFTLPDTPSVSSSPTLTIANESGGTPSVLTLARTTTQSFALNPSSLVSSASVLSTTGPTSLPDGTYDVTLSYADNAGHAAASTTHLAFTLDRTTLAPTLGVPTGGASGSALAVAFTLPEVGLAGSASLTFTGPQTVSISLADTATGLRQLTLTPSALVNNPDVTGVSPTGAALTPGVYNVTFAYQDALGNPVATATQSGVTISAATTSTTTSSSTSTQTVSTSSTATTTSSAPSSSTSTSTQTVSTTSTASASSTQTVTSTTATSVSSTATATSDTSIALPVSTATSSSHSTAAPVASRPAELAMTASPRRGDDGVIGVHLQVPASGWVVALATEDDPHLPGAATAGAPHSLHPGRARFVFARVDVTTTAAGGVNVLLKPTAAGRAIMARHRRHGWALHTRVTVVYETAQGIEGVGRHVVTIFPRRGRP